MTTSSAIQALFAIFIFIGHVHAEVVTRVANQTTTFDSGSGVDEARLLRDADVVFNGRSIFYIRYNVITRQIPAMRLPQTRIERTCGLKRRDGGSLGDYKSKNINDILWLGTPGGGNYIFRNYERNQDTNEVPSVRVYRINDTSQLTEYAKQELSSLCVNRSNRVTFNWTGHGDCRWKPENWFKPGDFPFEYRGPTVYDSFSIRLECVTR